MPLSERTPLRIGLISDTHGVLRPRALSWLQGCSHIIHAGDIGGRNNTGGLAILDALRSVAPLTVVRGNNDVGGWAGGLNDYETLDILAVRVHVLHDLNALKREPQELKCRVVVSGHSHKPLIVEREGTLFVNPGSAGPRRFKLPISMGELMLDGAGVEAKIIYLG